MVFSNYLIEALKGQIEGQEYAVAALTRAITLAIAGLRPHNRPLAVLMFIGPTGSGKTHVAQSLARILLGDERKIIYINCQQLSQATDPLTNLHGQLVVGYWRSQMAPPILPTPYSILLFEDIDKAPLAFRDTLVAAIDQGEIFTLGHLFSLHNSFVILTSSLSRRKTHQLIGRNIGFSKDSESDLELPRQHIIALEEIDNLLGSHLVSRIDEIIILEQPSEQNIITLLEQKLSEVEKFLAGSSIGFIIRQEAKTFLLRRGLEDPSHRVRQINRAVRNYLEFPLADLMLSGRLSPGTLVIVGYEAPRNFLDFQILIPVSVPPAKPQMLEAEAVE